MEIIFAIVMVMVIVGIMREDKRKQKEVDNFWEKIDSFKKF